jgi:Ca2+-binding EF-hand superfamily protein
MTTVLRLSLLFGALIVGLTVDATAQERRSRFDPASFLQRLDRNGNAVLEPEEMVGRARGFIENMGIEVSGPIPIENIMEVINRQRRDADRERAEQESAASGSDWGSSRLVPGFGVEQEQATLPGFGSASTNGSATPAAGSETSEPSESVQAQVERVLSQFDRNNDQVLDAGEIAGAPWGTPSPQESDANGDGRLTRDELIERYRRREADSERLNRGGRSRDESRSGDRRSRSETPNSNRSEPAVASTPQSAPAETSSSRPASVDKRIADYVENLLQQYDSDRDGTISTPEMEKMRSSPKGADSDSNGSLSRDELVAYYGGGYREGASAKESGTAESNDSNRESPRRSSRRNSSESSAADSLDGRRPVPMHEFTDVWTEEKLREFRELDKNGDGVISVEEFRQR